MTKTIKPTDIPNGFVVRSINGKPLLVDFDDNGNPDTDECLEIASDGWLAAKGMPENYIALVHTVKGEDSMLVRLLLMSQITDKQKRPVSAIKMGEKNRLLPFAKSLRDEYVKKISGFSKTSPDIGVVER
jgi:hypothetical protein